VDKTLDERRGHSRRHFLRNMGIGAAGAGAAAVAGPLAPKAKAAELPPIPSRGDRFTRMFDLPPFAQETQAVTDALTHLGEQGGVMDAKDDLSQTPKDLIVNPALSANNPDNPTHTAGTTFFGQFIDHDITFDATSELGQATDPAATQNIRSAAFDLDSVYGGGPIVDAQLYDPADKAKLVLGSGGVHEDLQRGTNGVAIIGDPRNDENLIIAGLQAAAISFHNAVVDDVERGNSPAQQIEAFIKARVLTTWHYQWLVLHQFLPQFVGQAMVDDILRRGRKIYRPSGEASIPVEFSGAAYRFGHSMVRPSYRANFGRYSDSGGEFFGMIFDPADNSQADPDDLRGGVRAKRRFIDWETFFDFGDGKVRRNKKIDTHISSPLMNLPLPVLPGQSGPSSLAQRNLLRHLTWELPSGQAIARRIHADPLAPGDLAELAQYGAGLETSTPLWYYVLKEAEVVANAEHLGPVGGRIVAEVFIGLMELDPRTWLASMPNWKPNYGTGGSFTMNDWLKVGGVDPAGRAS
jgi:hypothetical protein